MITDESTQDPEPFSIALVVGISDSAEFLDECLASVAAQDVFDELQVLLVDDAGSDGSADIAARFAAAHTNVSLIRRADERPGGEVHRTALRAVRAPLVSFLDGVDRLPVNGLGMLRSALRAHDADVAVGTVMALSDGPADAEACDGDSRLVLGMEDAEEVLRSAQVHGKLFTTAALRKLEGAFGARSPFEDPTVTVPTLFLAERLAMTEAPVYSRRRRTRPNESLWSRPQAYRDEVELARFFVRLRPTVPALRRRAFDQLRVRSFQGYALRAPEALTETELRAFFDSAVELFGGIDPSVLMEACANTRHRIAFVAFCLRSWRLFADRAATLVGVEAVDERLRLTLANDIPDVLQCLLVADDVTAHVESIDREEGGAALRVRGRFHVDGLPLLRPLPCALSLQVPGCGISESAGNQRRHIASAKKVTDDWSGFECVLPTSELRSGQHHLRLVFQTSRGEASAGLRPATGALRASRVMDVIGRRTLLLKRGQEAALRVQIGTGVRLRALWSARQFVDDLRQARARRPFWAARLVRLLTAPLFPGGVWLLGERRDTAQDNSFALFRHLRERRRDIRAYYVMDPASAHVSRVRPLGHMVPHSSWRHRLLMLHARVLVNSYDLDSYLLPSQWHAGRYLTHLAWRVGSRRVFLQHGVTYNNVSATLHRGVTGLDVFVTSSEREAEAIRSGMGFTTQVAVTGMPRFDHLHRGPVGRRILVMPTWRRDLVLPSYRRDRPGVAAREVAPFESSAFATFWRAFLNDERLLETLDRTSTTLEFFAHYEMDEVAGTLAPQHPRVQISRHGGRSVQEAILDSSLFVTDWSSTFFDAAYAGRPVVMVPFDEAEFRRTQYAAGYFDFDRDGFGPIARTADEAVAAVVGCVESGFVRGSTYEERVASFFAYRDSGQSQRVVEAISRVLSGASPQTSVPQAPPAGPLKIAS